MASVVHGNYACGGTIDTGDLTVGRRNGKKIASRSGKTIAGVECRLGET